MRVLVVDDAEENRYVLQVLLEGHDHQVDHAENGREALNIARLAKPDVLVTDATMPIMGGFELCRSWKADKDLGKIPIIMYTATLTEPSDEKLALASGCDRFIIKPYDPIELIRVIESVAKGTASEIPEEVMHPAVVSQMYTDRLIKKLEQNQLKLEKERCLPPLGPPWLVEGLQKYFRTRSRLSQPRWRQEGSRGSYNVQTNDRQQYSAHRDIFRSILPWGGVWS